MPKVQVVLVCEACGRPAPQWAGRCAGCGAWGSIRERDGLPAGLAPSEPLQHVDAAEEVERRHSTGLGGMNRVLGGGLVPGSVVLLAGEPGIGKSTLLLHVVANLQARGLRCLLASGEESRAQVAARARRLRLPASEMRYVGGRELAPLLAAAATERPDVLVVDSIQTLRDPDLPAMPGGPGQVRACADRLVGLAKEQGCAVILVGHVTKEGELAGPRTLEHAVDAVLTFEGEPRSGLRILAGGKNRFGSEGEVTWFEMGAQGLAEVDPAGRLRLAQDEPGAATALHLAGRRAVAVEVQALVVPGEGPLRRNVAGLDPRRFAIVAAVLSRTGFRVSSGEVYGAAGGGLRVDDPAADLAIAAALASACSGIAPPPRTAFVGEVSLTGAIRPAAAVEARAGAARAAGIERIVGAVGEGETAGVAVQRVRHVGEAVAWARRRRRGAASGENGL